MSTSVLDRPAAPQPSPSEPIQAGGGNAMAKVSIRGLFAHKMRFILTLLAVTLGTAFVTGSFVLTNALGNSINAIVGGTVQDTSVVVMPKDGNNQGVPLATTDKIRSVNGVAAVEPLISGMMTLFDSKGKALSTGGAPTAGYGYETGANNATAEYRMVDGQPPAASNEIMVNVDGLKKAGLKVGDTTKVALPKTGIEQVKVVGSYKFSFAVGGYVGVVFTPAKAKAAFQDGNAVSMIAVRGNSGVSQTDLRNRIATVLPSDVEAQTKDDYIADAGKQVASIMSYLNTFLVVFGVIGLVVGASLIYITFSMVIAQRLRELALLRAIGASRAQVLRSVLGEGLLVGLVGSLLGVVLGWVLGWGLLTLLGKTMGVPMGSATLTPGGIATAVGLGIGITVLSALAPALRAGNTPPVEAMGGQFRTPRVTRLRMFAGVFLLLAAVVLTVAAMAKHSLATLGIAAFVILIAMLVASPMIAPVVFAAFRPLTRLTPVGRLAHGNAVRNPKRTAATAAALALGLALITAAAVVAASTKATMTDAITKGQNWDYMVMSQQSPIPPYMAAKIKAVPNTSDLNLGTAPLPLTLNETIRATTVDGDLSKAMTPAMASGNATLTGDSMMVPENTAADKNWKVGDKVTFTSPMGASKTLTIVGITKRGGLLDNVLVPASAVKQFVPREYAGAWNVLITPTAGADKAAIQKQLDDATASNPMVLVKDKKAYEKMATSQVDVMLGVLYGLLGLSVVISILGIVNTLALSVVERVRELGMMRAIGAQRSQVRRMITGESVLICTYGAIVGLLVGLIYGWLFMGLLRDQGLTSRVIPWGQAIGFLIAAIIVGLLAAVWPAIKAARTKPLEAIAEG